MTVKLFGVVSLKLYYEAPHKSDVIRWATESFQASENVRVEVGRILPEPMMTYDDSKNYHEVDINNYQTDFILDTKVLLTKTGTDGTFVKKRFSNKREAASFLHVGIKTMRAADGEIIKGWRVRNFD